MPWPQSFRIAARRFSTRLPTLEPSERYAIETKMQILRCPLSLCRPRPGEAPVQDDRNELDQGALGLVRVNPEVLIRERCCLTPARRQLQEANLDQEWLIHFFDGVHFFAERSGERVHPDRAAAVLLDDGEQ